MQREKSSDYSYDELMALIDSFKTTNLVELINNYQFILRTRGRGEGDRFLNFMWCPEKLHNDIAFCFNENGTLKDVPCKTEKILFCLDALKLEAEQTVSQ